MKYKVMVESTLPDDIKETVAMRPCINCGEPTHFAEIGSKRHFCSEKCKYAFYERHMKITMLSEITPEMIDNGLNNGSVVIIDSPNGDGAACQIGVHWFYAFGSEGETMTAEEYTANVPREDIVREITEALRSFRSTPGFEDEYAYYLAFISENVRMEDD